MKTGRLDWMYPLALALAVALVYSNALDGPFFLDDNPAIVENPALRALWPLSAALHPPPREVTFFARPFIHLTMCVDYARGGLNPRAYRLTSLLFHLAAAMALSGLVRRTLQVSGWDSATATHLGGMAALLWAAHPLNTAAVNYLSQRSELAMGFFFFLMLYGLNRAAGPRALHGDLRSRAWLAVAFFSCLLGMGSKESMAVAPLLAAAYDRFFLSSSWKEVFQKRFFFYVLLLATVMWPVSRQLVYSTNVPPEGLRPLILFWLNPLTQAWGLVRMLGLFIWPRPLIMDYGTDLATRLGQVWPQALIVLALLGATLGALKRHPRIGFLGLCFFALLAPSSLIPIIGQPVAEHRMYAPLAPLAVLAIVGLHGAVVRLAGSSASRVRTVFLLIAGAWVLMLGAASHRRNAIYESPLRLWSDTVAKRPANWRAWSNLGAELRTAGRYEEWLAVCEKVVQLNPHTAPARRNLAVALCAVNRIEESLEHFRTALRMDPSLAESQSDYGTALLLLGRHREALEPLQKAVRMLPGLAQAHNSLGQCLAQLHRKEEALDCFREALRLNPAFIQASAQLGLTLIELGRGAEVRSVLEEGARRSPDIVAVLNEFASFLLAKGHSAEGLELSLRVLEIQPTYPPALNNAAWVMAVSTNEALRDGARAVEYASRAVQLLGDQAPSALATLAAAQAEAGHFAEAVALSERLTALARQQGNSNLVRQCALRLERFRQGQPWRE